MPNFREKRKPLKSENTESIDFAVDYFMTIKKISKIF